VSLQHQRLSAASQIPKLFILATKKCKVCPGEYFFNLNVLILMMMMMMFDD
jgi:hypothetical protein